MLIYGTGGFVYGRVEEDIVLNSQAGVFGSIAGFAFSCVAGPNCFSGNSSRTATGWTAGAGIEYAPWNNVSFKGEYLYVNLGSGDTVTGFAVNSAGAPPSTFTADYGKTDFHVARAGINFHFGGYGKGPVVTRY